MTTTTPSPIFLLGIFERSGTNYLYDLVRAHPDCGVRRPIWEDKLLRQAHMLEHYVDTVVTTWDTGWHYDPAERDLLLRSLGDGLVRFLAEGVDEPTFIVKTPSVTNLPMFFDVWPEGRLLILVRDGRSVTESAVRSFGWSYPVTMKQWSDAARTVVAATRQFDAAGLPYQLVRYEELLADVRGVLTPLLSFGGLDPARYDFDAAERTPVRGSSTVRPEEGGAVDWQEVERPSDFAPERRFEEWEPALFHLYAELAGEAAAALGYPGLDDLPALDTAGQRRVLRWRAELAGKLGQRAARRLSQRLLYNARTRLRR